MARSTSVKEFTFGKKFADFVNAWDFDADNFAAYLIGLPGPVLMKVLKALFVLIDNMALAYQNDLYAREDMDVFVKAQQMRDAMEHFQF